MSAKSPRATRRRSFQELGLVLVILVLGAVLTWQSGSTTLYDSTTAASRTVNIFLNPLNLDNLAKATSCFAIMAVGATLVIIIGGIDLSVGAIYALAAVSGAKLLHHFGPEGPSGHATPVWVVPAAGLACLGVGTACGLINGFCTVGLRLHPFIITLGTMAIFRNMAFVWTEGQSIGTFPPAFTDGLIRRQWHGLYPVPMTIMLAVTVAGWIYLNYTRGGRLIFAVGGNELAARYSGVAVNRRKIIVFGLAGLTAGIAAMIAIGYYGAASSDDGKGYELQAIAAAVVGGASLVGGKGTAWGALLGALLIRMIDNGIVVLDYPQQYGEIIMGASIIAAAVLDRITAGLTERRLLGTA